ncbi:MAG: polyprenyl synthetase family protein [Bacteroidales bacterium]|nr:polyprenyl synthetase family protein [Bacteroidales bacterium]
MCSYKQLLEKVQTLFASENFMGNPAQLYEPIKYTLSLGGKRIRPVLLLAATDLFGGDIEAACPAAIGIETFHNFTLLHDDLMDKSPIRRGQPTVYRKWNENIAILSGDAMNILAWRYFLKQPHKNLHQILSTFEKTSMEICEGQQYDMNFETRDDVTKNEYMEMIRLKTAVLLAGALKIGALYADAPDDDIEQIYNFGIFIGLAFQLRDDLLDAYGDVSTFGKQTGTDIKDNKKTFLLLHAIEKCDKNQQEELRRLFSYTPADPSHKIERVLEIYDSLDIRTDVENEIGKLHSQASTCLDAIHRSNNDKQPLRELAESLLERNV